MAGLKVCLVEKGRRWEAQDFPTSSLKILSTFRFESSKLGISFGPRDALFQVYEQEDCLAAMACGLGGGSLVNAGVMIPAPVRAKRNVKWPKEWENDWELCEASASSMLRAQSVPTKFQNSKVMEDIIKEEFEVSIESPLKLSINFDENKQPLNSKNPAEMGSCLACGNCLSGCPYNAKSSTDKNYIFSAIQEGCTIRTDCEVQYVVKNLDKTSKEKHSSTKRRRWLVFFNEIDHVKCDFVVLSAGVFGTNKILFQSQQRGLKLSSMLGSGISCNGNNVAYLARSSAPLNASGLDRKNFSELPFQERPGPAISSSYTNSLGFTIQSAVLPTPYIYMLFKGFTSYSWPGGYGIIHEVLDKLMVSFGMKKSQGMVLNVMGYDESDGKITFERDTNKIYFQAPKDTLLPRKIKALQKLSEKLGGLLYMSKYRSTSVHLLGGCNAASDPSHGVCNSNGQVFDTNFHDSVHTGLYVCDASLIPCSVGINPSLTIATVSEHVSRHLVKDVLNYENMYGARFNRTAIDQKLSSMISKNLGGSRTSSIAFTEIMRGHVGGMPISAHLRVKLNMETCKDFDNMNMMSGKSHPLLRGKVGGYVVCPAVESDKIHVIDGEVDLCEVDIRTPYTQYMHYKLTLAASSGSRYILEGRKVLNPFLLGFYMIKESTSMNVTFKKVTANNTKEQEAIVLKGELHISVLEIIKCLISMKGRCKGKFICLLLESFLRTYILRLPRGINKDFTTPHVLEKPYPSSDLLKIETEDGFIISCKRWKCSQSFSRLGHKILYPVLLINGYSTESYWLPTEPNDLVRTLLEQGHETWILQPRLHPSNSSNCFTIKDIGRYDIPKVIDKIIELNGRFVKVHVVAHCVGGLAMHIALLGGHLSSSKIASLSCTNSSMFFKLTALPSVKMRLPLLPMSMVILGKNKTLPLFGTLKTTSSQRLIRAIARLMPRYERCSCDECEIFSGIFGNTFWHNNITSSMHYWMNKKSLPALPMAAFPHLRIICNTGFIVDENGKNTYLIHPERMALPTLYISGGRTLLVTPQTSFLANKYMKLHQPDHRHERVVVDGFGHSDLLIGEKSYKKVFPHILSHIGLAEEEKTSSAVKKKYYSKEALAWGNEQQYEEGKAVFWCCIFTILLAVVLLFTVFS
ncbi:hypothetical protein DCAR_0208758 [Daucus carota subsp. sativus]|uniref:Cholesterol oxidase n=2 Tax=Daucus carota subsp. sativus TaxID=79200 RepID=A0AAF1ARE1_DAUCS|nr:hypothetical protein DCAR_0208758 [Daucus carota subsp. sativus]